MRKYLKARLKLSAKSWQIMLDRKEDVVDWFDNNLNIEYDIYLAEYRDEECCIVDIGIIGSTTQDVRNDYKNVKLFIKQITNDKIEQVLKLEGDKIL